MPLMLLRQHGSVPRFHGNGFTQLPLPDSRRLHVWHPSLPPIPGHNATIHNHVWDMQSRVLLGSLIHRVWRVEYAHCRLPSQHAGEPDRRGTHDVYQLGEQRPDRLINTATPHMAGEYQMSAGSIYVFPAGEFHESEAHPDDIVATVMQKRGRSEDRPLVLCPRGDEPVDAFAPEHQPSLDAMWAAIEEAVLAMSSHTRLELKSCLSD